MSSDQGTLIVPAPERRPRTWPAAIDCGIRLAPRSLAELAPYLSRRWRDHLDHYGPRRPMPFLPVAAAPPPPPGAELVRLKDELLDRFDIGCGLLQPAFPEAMGQRNQELGAALCRAANEWVVEHWTGRDRRLKAAITVPAEDSETAVEEIERWATHPGFVQIALSSPAIEPLGRRRYWPIYDAAQRHDLPVVVVPAGCNGHAPSGAGWPGSDVEVRQLSRLAQQAVVVSLVTEGVFELYATLRVVLADAGFAWVPALCWRFDQHWERMRDEVPHLTRLPSASVRRHFWFATWPAEAAAHPEELRRVLDWIGWGQILFASGWPRPGWAAPEETLAVRAGEEERRAVLAGNARALYGLV